MAIFSEPHFPGRRTVKTEPLPAAQFLPLNKIIFLIRQNIRHVNGLALERRSSGYSPAAWNERVPFNVLNSREKPYFAASS